MEPKSPEEPKVNPNSPLYAKTEALENEEEKIYNDILKYISENKSDKDFGNVFSVEDYWTKVLKHNNTSDLEKYGYIKENIIKTFDKLVELDKLDKKADGNYAVPVSQIENTETQEANPESTPPPTPSPRFAKATLGESSDEGKNQNVEAEQEPEENIPNWRESEEWDKFKELRSTVAKMEAKKHNFDTETGGSKGDMQEQYESKRRDIAEKIKETITAENSDLSPEELKRKINDTLFEELILSEHDAYMSALREARGERWMDKAIVQTKNFLGQSAIKWYRKQNKFKRLAVVSATFAIGVGVGTFVGTASAGSALAAGAGYGLYRSARGLGSMAAFAGVGKLGKMSIQKIDELEKKQIEDVKGWDLSLEEKSKQVREIKEQANKARMRNRIIAGVGGMVAAGAGGIATGEVLDNIYHAADIVPGTLDHDQLEEVSDHTQVSEATPQTESVVTPEAETPQPEAPEPEETPASSEAFEPTEFEVSSTEHPVPEPTVAELVSPLPTEESVQAEAPTSQVTIEQIFNDPEKLEHIKMGGNNNSIWKAIEEGFKENKEFNDMNRAQKDNVIAFFTNKAIKNPLKYDFTPDKTFGVKVEPNQEINLSKLLGNPEEIKKVLDGATGKTANELQSISANREAITAWISDPKNAGVELTTGKVSEILNTKPEVEIPTKFESETSTGAKLVKPTIPEDFVEPIKSPIPENIENQNIVEPIKSPIPETLETLEKIETPEPAPVELNQEELDAIVAESDQNQIRQDILDAKARLAELEGNKRNPNLERSFTSDTEFANQIESAFRNEINEVYGKSGLFGIGKVEGVNTKEWGEMARLPANKVVEYYNNPENSDLPPQVLESLSKSVKHRSLVEQIHGIMDEIKKNTRADLNPIPRENMEQFIKRIGKFLMEHPPKLEKAA